MSELKKIIGENIRYERQARNMSLEDLAEIIGITPGFLGLVERGQRGTDFKNLIKICEVFGITIDSLSIRKAKNELKVAEKDYETADVKRSTINSLIFDLNPVQLEFVISVIKNLKIMFR